MQVMGKLQVGSTEPLEFSHYSLRGGLNIKDVPQEVADDDLTVGYNGYLLVSGGFRMRNGISKHGSALTGSGPILGLARFYQNIVAGAVQNPQVVKLLAQVAGTLRNADTNAAIGAIGVGAGPMTWVRAQDPQAAGGLTDVMVICTGVGGPYLYDGTAISTPAGWAAAAGASWCASVNGVVYFGGIPSQPRQVMGTGDGSTLYSFETLPAVNLFTVSQPVTGLSSLGTGVAAALVVGTTNGLTMIYGTGPNNYFQQDVPSFNDGVVAGRSMISEGGVCYFLGRQAIYSFDGASQPVQISIKVEPWILNDPYVPGYPMDQGRNLAFSFIYNNKLHVGYCSGAAIPNTVLCFDLIVKAWTVLQSSPGMYCAAALDATTDPSPATLVVGSNASPQVYNWDVSPGVGTIATDDGASITAAFQTKFFKIGIPGTNKLLTRVYPELFLSGPLTASWTTTTDYGSEQFTSLIAQTPSTGATWDVSSWDLANWASLLDFVPFNAPASRIDLAIQAESFAFGMLSTGSVSPWIMGGLSGVVSQLGRT